MTWELTLTGLLIGLLVGVTGMGGGSLMTPILVLVFNFNVVVAVGTDILHGAIFKTVGAWRHRLLGHVHARLTSWLALGSVPASVAGVYVVELLQRRHGDDVNDVASVILGAALVLGGAGVLLRTLVKAKPPSNRPYHLRNRDRVLAVATGLAGGLILGMTSVGSGTFFGLVLILLFPLTAPKIVGTDIFHAAVLLWAAGLTHLWAENVDMTAIAWLLLGSIPGVVIGSHSTVRLPERGIRTALALVLLAAGVKLSGLVPGF